MTSEKRELNFFTASLNTLLTILKRYRQTIIFIQMQKWHYFPAFRPKSHGTGLEPEAKVVDKDLAEDI